MKSSTPELSPEQQRYKANKAFRLPGNLYTTCGKCGHKTKPGDLLYKDLANDKTSHITCKQKKAAAKDETSDESAA